MNRRARLISIDQMIILGLLLLRQRLNGLNLSGESLSKRDGVALIQIIQVARCDLSLNLARHQIGILIFLVQLGPLGREHVVRSSR